MKKIMRVRLSEGVEELLNYSKTGGVNFSNEQLERLIKKYGDTVGMAIPSFDYFSAKGFSLENAADYFERFANLYETHYAKRNLEFYFRNSEKGRLSYSGGFYNPEKYITFTGFPDDDEREKAGEMSFQEDFQDFVKLKIGVDIDRDYYREIFFQEGWKPIFVTLSELIKYPSLKKFLEYGGFSNLRTEKDFFDDNYADEGTFFEKTNRNTTLFKNGKYLGIKHLL